MTTPNRIHYFRPQKVGFFSTNRQWKKDICKPLNNPQARVLMDKEPRGWTPPPPPPPPAGGEPRTSQSEGEKENEKLRGDSAPGGTSAVGKDEDCRTPPPFDMLDIPDAMEKMGFYVAAKLARRWFNGRKHVLSDDAAAPYPDDMVVSSGVSLEFILKHDGVAKKFKKN